MSTKRNIQLTRIRALRSLERYSELTFSQIAKKAGISRMHLYRLARRFSDVRSLYVETLFWKREEAGDLVYDAACGTSHDHKKVYAAGQKAMRYGYYLSCWEPPEASAQEQKYSLDMLLSIVD